MNARSGKGVRHAEFLQHYLLQLGVLEKYFGKKGENETCEERNLFIYSFTLKF